MRQVNISNYKVLGLMQHYNFCNWYRACVSIRSFEKKKLKIKNIKHIWTLKDLK